jgi:riboflavin synthase
MFTGIIETTGRVEALQPVQTGARLVLEAPEIMDGTAIGESVAVNGCCLTVTSIDGNTLAFDLLAETLRCTNLGDLKTDAHVNLERAVAVGSRMGGHFVQGHIDCSSEVMALEPVGADHRLVVAMPKKFSRYVSYKGSIAVDGISLTVAEVGKNRFTIWIIPHTMEVTNLSEASAGTRVNLEFDMLAKYVERLLKSVDEA